MRTPVAVTLIIAGAFIVALPPMSDALRTIMETHALTHGANLAPWEGVMEGPYRFACWSVGAVMIGIAIKGAITMPSSQDERRMAASAR